MTNLIPTATIILAEISVVLLILLSVLGFRYLRRNRQHRREIETLMEMARDSRVALPGSKAAAAATIGPVSGKTSRTERKTAADPVVRPDAIRAARPAATQDVDEGHEAPENVEVRRDASGLQRGNAGPGEAAVSAAAHIDPSDETIEAAARVEVAAPSAVHAAAEPARRVATSTDATGGTADTVAATAVGPLPVADHPAPPSDPAAVIDPGPPAPATTDGRSAERPTGVPGLHEILILRRTVTALEGKVVQAHRDHLQLAGRMRRGMDRVTEDVAAMRRDIAQLMERFSNDRASAPPRSGGQPVDAIDRHDFATHGAGLGAVLPEEAMDLTGESPADRNRDSISGADAGSGEHPAGHPFGAASGPAPDTATIPAIEHPIQHETPRSEETPAWLDAGVPGSDRIGSEGILATEVRSDEFLHEMAQGDGEPDPVDPYALHDAAGPTDEGSDGWAADAPGAGSPVGEDPDYLLDSETIQRLLGGEAVAASPPGGGIDVEEISLSEFGAQHTPPPAPPRQQPFTSHQDDIFFQSSTSNELEQGWYITLPGEPPEGPFSDKQTAERVLNEVRGHTAGRSAQGG